MHMFVDLLTQALKWPHMLTAMYYSTINVISPCVHELMSD